jgi:hypothetical protein
MQDRKFQATGKTSIYPTVMQLLNCKSYESMMTGWMKCNRSYLIDPVVSRVGTSISLLPDLQKLKSLNCVAFSERWVRTRSTGRRWPLYEIPLSQNSHQWRKMPTNTICNLIVPHALRPLEWFAMIHKVQEIADPWGPLRLVFPQRGIRLGAGSI